MRRWSSLLASLLLLTTVAHADQQTAARSAPQIAAALAQQPNPPRGPLSQKCADDLDCPDRFVCDTSACLSCCPPEAEVCIALCCGECRPENFPRAAWTSADARAGACANPPRWYTRLFGPVTGTGQR